jgi:hypothetical protein
MVATLGIFFVTLGFANEFVIATDIYVEVDSDTARDDHFQLCLSLMDELYSIENEKCQEAVNDRVFDAMIDFIVSGLQVLGGILLWFGLSGFRTSLMKSIETEQNDINTINKRIKKLKKGLDKEAEQDNRKNE